MRRLLMLAVLAVAGVASAGAGTAVASASLPDNRAWEIVTPPDQNHNVIPVYLTPADGNMAAFRSLGPFAGSLNGGGDGYVARRGSGGWTTEAMAPPGSGVNPEPLFILAGLSRDGSHVIWSAAGAGRDVFFGTGRYSAVNLTAGLRSGTDSAFFEGQTPDADHVVFGVYPSGGAAQLYDYTGGSATPLGILPGETTPDPGGAVLGSFEKGYGTGSVFHAISDDGSRIFFESPEPAAVASGNLPNPSGLYVRENGTSTKAIDANAIYWDATTDGSSVLYSPVDGSGNRGIATYDVAHEQATEIVPASAQVQGIGGVSDDLSHIYFVALGDLADGATAGQGNVYLYDGDSDGDKLRYVATVDPTSGGNFSQAARFSSTDPYRANAVTSMASADGRLLLFVTTRKLTSYDNQGVDEVYLFDAEATANPLVCISCTDDAAPIAGSYLQTRPTTGALGGGVGTSQNLTPPTNITVDNRRVFFQTPNALVPQDHNGVDDVYEWQDGAAHLISSGAGSEARLVAATPSGDDVFFATKNSLTWQAKSGDLFAIYDARVGGGFPPPPGPATPCDQGGRCQGAPAAPPLLAAPASVGFQGSGNVTGQTSSGTHTPKAPVFRVAPIGRKARARLARGGRAAIRVRIGASGKVRVVLRAKVGKHMRTVARASRMARRAGTVRLMVRLSKPARRALRRGHRLRVRVVARYSKVHATRRASFVLAGTKRERGR